MYYLIQSKYNALVTPNFHHILQLFKSFPYSFKSNFCVVYFIECIEPIIIEYH